MELLEICKLKINLLEEKMELLLKMQREGVMDIEEASFKIADTFLEIEEIKATIFQYQ